MDVFDRLKAATADDWQSYVDHDFVRQMGAGTLPQAAFRTYLVQDYLFLIQFARAYALATYKSRTLADMKAAQAGWRPSSTKWIFMYGCAAAGAVTWDIEAAPEHQATIAYTRFVLDCGAAGRPARLACRARPVRHWLCGDRPPPGARGRRSATIPIANGSPNMQAMPIRLLRPRRDAISMTWPRGR